MKIGNKYVLNISTHTVYVYEVYRYDTGALMNRLYGNKEPYTT